MREALARSDRDFAQAPRRARARAIEIEEIEEGESMGDRVSAFMRTYSKSPLPCCWPPRPAPSSGTLVLQTSRHRPLLCPRKGRYPAPLPPLRPCRTRSVFRLFLRFPLH